MSDPFWWKWIWQKAVFTVRSALSFGQVFQFTRTLWAVYRFSQESCPSVMTCGSFEIILPQIHFDCLLTNLLPLDVTWDAYFVQPQKLVQLISLAGWYLLIAPAHFRKERDDPWPPEIYELRMTDTMSTQAQLYRCMLALGTLIRLATPRECRLLNETLSFVSGRLKFLISWLRKSLLVSFCWCRCQVKPR